MEISNIDIVQYALVPGAAEALEKMVAEDKRLVGIVRWVKNERDHLYFTVALTVIGALGAAMASEEGARFACQVVATLGVALSISAAKSLRDSALFFQQVF